MLKNLQTVIRFNYNYGDSMIKHTLKYPPRVQPQ